MKTYKCIFCNEPLSSNSAYEKSCADGSHHYLIYFHGPEDIWEEDLSFEGVFLNYKYDTSAVSKHSIYIRFSTDEKGKFIRVPGMTMDNKPVFHSEEEVRNFILLA